MKRWLKKRRAMKKGTGAAIPVLGTRFAVEQSLRDIHKLLTEKEFENESELNAYLSTLTGEGLKRAMADRPRDRHERAQELAFQAMGAPSSAAAIKLALQAVELDPNCVDALRLLALYGSNSRQEYIEKLYRVVETGERALGKKFFQENHGHFWGILETRPYMRARLDLAFALREAGRIEEAVSQLEATLDLNPNDNQGCRDVLIGCYLLMDRLDGVRRLLEKYHDGSALFLWATVLERFLASDMPGAAAALKVARKENSNVESYLTGRKPMPRKLPQYYSPGDDNEAIHCMSNLGAAWQRHPAAVAWLQAACER
jgi:tetratricopeptide (TPR) repeat protein